MQTQVINREGQLDLAARVHSATATIPSTRDEIKRRLDEAERAATRRQQLERDISDLEARIEQAVSEHQEQAHRLHIQRAESSDRETWQLLGGELVALNNALQTKCNDINHEIGELQRQRDDAFVVESTIGALRRALHKSADSALQAELQVAENTLAWASERCRAAKKRLAELDSQIGCKPAAGKQPQKVWGREQAEPTRYSDSTMAQLEWQREVWQLEETTAAAILAEAEQEVAALKAQLLV